MLFAANRKNHGHRLKQQRSWFLSLYIHLPSHLSSSRSMANPNLSYSDNMICDGSPSRIRSVRRISLKITTLPKSSILLTIPVAFISRLLFLPAAAGSFRIHSMNRFFAFYVKMRMLPAAKTFSHRKCRWRTKSVFPAALPFLIPFSKQYSV